MHILVTGGAGFIGSNFIRHILNARADVSIVNYDLLTYAGNLENCADIESAFPGRYAFIRGDIADYDTVLETLKEQSIDTVVNFAAESHVDRSIIDSSAFIQTNIVGTKALLDAALESAVSLFVQISTDEVYGSLGPGDPPFTERHVIAPNSPYSASKAASDHLVRAYNRTYGFPAVTTRCSNNYGPYQFPEKLIPLLITNALDDRELPVYGDGRNVRDWIHVDDHSRAVESVIFQGKPGEVYNIGGGNECENITMVKQILELLKKPESLIRHVTDRPGHDKRYAMDYSKLQSETGWKPEKSFSDGISETIDWYIDNSGWTTRVKTREYLSYYERNYTNR